MRGKLWFIVGLAAGFVLGARAGREKYEELVRSSRKFLDHPTVQEAAGVAQAQANRLYSEGRDRLSQTRLGEKLHLDNGGAARADEGFTSPSPGSQAGSATTTSGTLGRIVGSDRGVGSRPEVFRCRRLQRHPVLRLRTAAPGRSPVATGPADRVRWGQSLLANAASKAAAGASKASRRTNCSASGAPTRRSIPASSHSIEIGPS